MERRIAVLMAIDEPYAAPLCVAVTSLLDHLRPGTGLDLYVMGSDLSAATRRALADAFDARVSLSWVTLADPQLRSLRGYGYVGSPAANFRLVAGSSLPSSVEKVVYLDADVLVRRDLVELAERDMQGNVVLAVQDGFIQSLPACCSPASTPVTRRPYFNSGVMVIDLAAWRAAGIETACLAAARRLRHRTKWLDQHALNAALVDRWGMLPPAWNKQFWLDLVPDWRCSPYGEIEFEDARREPAIIHFCTQTKPWQSICDHARDDVLAYRAVSRRTPFGARDVTRLSLGRRMFERVAAPHRRVRDTTAAAVRATRRGHALRVMGPAIARSALRHPWTILSVPLAVLGERVAIRGRRLGAHLLGSAPDA